MKLKFKKEQLYMFVHEFHLGKESRSFVSGLLFHLKYHSNQFSNLYSLFQEIIDQIARHTSVC